MKHLTIDEAIASLVDAKARLGGGSPVMFGDGSPVQFMVTDDKELSPEKLTAQCVQVRLDKRRASS